MDQSCLGELAAVMFYTQPLLTSAGGGDEEVGTV